MLIFIFFATYLPRSNETKRIHVMQFSKKKKNIKLRRQKCKTKNDLKSVYRQNFAILIKASSQIIPQRRSGLSREKPHFIPERSPGI